MNQWIGTASSGNIAGLPRNRGQVLTLDKRSGLAIASPIPNQRGGGQ